MAVTHDVASQHNKPWISACIYQRMYVLKIDTVIGTAVTTTQITRNAGLELYWPYITDLVVYLPTDLRPSKQVRVVHLAYGSAESSMTTLPLPFLYTTHNVYALVTCIRINNDFIICSVSCNALAML